jgi:hypothetical protein
VTSSPLNPVEALSPCPHCGNDGSGPIEDALHIAHVEDENHHSYDRYTVQCDKCTATMGYSDTEEEATTAWNTRIKPLPNEEVERAASALVTKLDECQPHIADAFLHRHLRCGPYSGPTYADELTALRAALNRPAPASAEGLREAPVAWRYESRDVSGGVDTGWHFCYSDVEVAACAENRDRIRNPEPLYSATALASLPDAQSNGAAARRTWRHKVCGTVYEEIGTAELRATNVVDEGALLTIYRGEDGKWWARRASEFGDGRFERIITSAKPATPEGQQDSGLITPETKHSRDCAYVTNDGPAPRTCPADRDNLPEGYHTATTDERAVASQLQDSSATTVPYSAVIWSQRQKDSSREKGR